MKKTRNVLYSLAGSVALITFIVYLPALRNEFLEWDDRYYVFANPFIRSFNAAFFRAAFLDFYVSNWHPLTWISHALDYAIWGLNPVGHHLTNNILHAINAFIVVLLVVRLLDAVKERTINPENATSMDQRSILITAGVTGALFGLHPLHVESVAWIAERKDVLCALFFLLSIMQYANYVGSESNDTVPKSPLSVLSSKQYLFALGFFILALLSKPMAVTLPVVLLILDWYPFNRIPSLKAFRSVLLEKLPFAVLSLSSSIVTVFAQHAAMTTVTFAPLSTRLLVASKSLVLYLWKMVWPLNLVPLYPYPDPTQVSLLSFKYLFAIMLVAGITIACIVIVKKQRVWLAAWGYFVVTLLPVIGIVQVGSQSMADRYTYLPSLGPFLIMGLGTAWVFTKAYRSKRSRLMVQLLGAVTAIFIFVAVSFLTVKQIGNWKNSFIFWNYFLANETAESPIPHINLGMAFEGKHLIDKAIEQYQIALRLDPNDREGHNDLGVVYDDKGMIDQAIEQYQIALRLNPNYTSAHNNLGEAYKKKGFIDQAIEQYQIALRLDPYYAVIHNNLGEAYMMKGSIDQAIEQYQIALRLDPNDTVAHNNLGRIYEKKGLIDQAIEQYQAAVRSAPDSALARNNLGKAYERKGLITQAIEQYEIIERLEPNYAVAHHLGESYQKKGLLDKAIEQYKVALTLQPDDFDSHTNLGVVYKDKGMKDQAIEQFRIALKLKPDSPLAHNNLGTAYGMFGLTDQAIEQFRIAVELDPANENWRKNLAMAYKQKRLGLHH